MEATPDTGPVAESPAPEVTEPAPAEVAPAAWPLPQTCGELAAAIPAMAVGAWELVADEYFPDLTGEPILQCSWIIGDSFKMSEATALSVEVRSVTNDEVVEYREEVSRDSDYTHEEIGGEEAVAFENVGYGNVGDYKVWTSDAMLWITYVTPLNVPFDPAFPRAVAESLVGVQP